jgi:hypothetical protein
LNRDRETPAKRNSQRPLAPRNSRGAAFFVWKLEIMTDNSHKKPESDRGYERKRRACLRCQKQFNSSWPGERVCMPCKSTTEWREGIAA